MRVSLVFFFLLVACSSPSPGVPLSATPNAVILSGAPAGRAVEGPATVVPNYAHPHAKRVVVVIMENRDYDLIIGNSQAPYINGTLVPEAALMTNSHAIGHPSEPNYLAFFSGSAQGIRDDSCPHTFSTANVGAELLAAGKTFDGYSESMPYDGYTGCTYGKYARKHNPWVNFTNVPSTSNLVYNGLPQPVPALTIVVPNLCDDMHDCSTGTGDTWLKNNLPAFLTYDNAHDGLLILTWDEADPDNDGTNHIATLLIGPTIVPGSYAQNVNHYSVLRTIEKVLGVPCTAGACQAQLLKGMWK